MLYNNSQSAHVEHRRNKMSVGWNSIGLLQAVTDDMQAHTVFIIISLKSSLR